MVHCCTVIKYSSVPVAKKKLVEILQHCRIAEKSACGIEKLELLGTSFEVIAGCDYWSGEFHQVLKTRMAYENQLLFCSEHHSKGVEISDDRRNADNLRK